MNEKEWLSNQENISIGIDKPWVTVFFDHASKETIRITKYNELYNALRSIPEEYIIEDTPMSIEVYIQPKTLGELVDTKSFEVFNNSNQKMLIWKLTDRNDARPRADFFAWTPSFNTVLQGCLVALRARSLGTEKYGLEHLLEFITQPMRDANNPPEIVQRFIQTNIIHLMDDYTRMMQRKIQERLNSENKSIMETDDTFRKLDSSYFNQDPYAI